MAEMIDGWWVTVRAHTDQFREDLSEASRLGGRFASDLTRAFEDAALKGRSLAAALRPHAEPAVGPARLGDTGRDRAGLQRHVLPVHRHGYCRTRTCPS